MSFAKAGTWNSTADGKSKVDLERTFPQPMFADNPSSGSCPENASREKDQQPHVPEQKTSTTRAARNRKPDPLPYTMENKNVEVWDEISGPHTCPTCGPPFSPRDVSKLEGLSICSFECGKRYIEQVVAHPNGFSLKHGKSPDFVKEEGFGHPGGRTCRSRRYTNVKINTGGSNSNATEGGFQNNISQPEFLLRANEIGRLIE